MKKEITVLIPTFNREDLLDRAIQSLSQQNQEIKIHCIISDNSSFDNTKDVVNKWKKQDKNFIIHAVSAIYFCKKQKDLKDFAKKHEKKRKKNERMRARRDARCQREVRRVK